MATSNTELYGYDWEVTAFDDATKVATVVYTPRDTALPTITKTMTVFSNVLFYVTANENAPRMEWFKARYAETDLNVLGQSGTGLTSVYVGSSIPPRPSV